MHPDLRENGHISKREATQHSLAHIADNGIQEPTHLTAICDPHYLAYHTSGLRQLSAIKWVVMHDTEGGTAAGIARYFSTPSSGGSAHLVVDDQSCYRCVPDNKIPWGAPGANTQGFHIEQCGYAKWTTLWMSKHRDTLERAAYKTALHCRKFGIPPYFVVAADLRAGKPGVTTHAECTKAFGGDHTDPGAGWPRYWFMRRVRYWYGQLEHVKRVA